jgi:hypothetical protein
MIMDDLKPEIKKIVDMWNTGASSSDIAHEVNRTRNSVIGILNRLREKGYSVNRKAALKTKPDLKRRKVREVKTSRGWVRQRDIDIKQILIRAKKNYSENPSVGMTLMDLKSTSCRYVIETHSKHGTLFCGNENYKRSYCEEHFRLCYYPVRKD